MVIESGSGTAHPMRKPDAEAEQSRTANRLGLSPIGPGHNWITSLGLRVRKRSFARQCHVVWRLTVTRCNTTRVRIYVTSTDVTDTLSLCESDMAE